MPQLRLGLGANISVSIKGYDSDAASYFSTAGVTDATAKTQINLFVIGVKNLGLWSNMSFWTFRSSQNAGSGTTAYSLSGIGTYNGTLVNTPSWGENGITFTSSNSQYITTTFDSSGTNITHAACVTPQWISNAIPTSSESATRKMSLRLSAINTGGVNFFGSGATSFNANNTIVDQQPTFLTASFKNNEVQLTTNTTTNTPSTTAALATGNGGFMIGARNFSGSDQFFNGSIAFASVGNIFLTLTQQSDLYSLYKTTLGQGLGLP